MHIIFCITLHNLPRCCASYMFATNYIKYFNNLTNVSIVVGTAASSGFEASVHIYLSLRSCPRELSTCQSNGNCRGRVDKLTIHLVLGSVQCVNISYIYLSGPPCYMTRERRHVCLAASVSSRVIVHCSSPQLVNDSVAGSLCTVAVLIWSMTL